MLVVWEIKILSVMISAKSYVITFAKQKIHDSHITISQALKKNQYSGVSIDNTLTFEKHVVMIVKKSKKSVNYYLSGKSPQILIYSSKCYIYSIFTIILSMLLLYWIFYIISTEAVQRNFYITWNSIDILCVIMIWTVDSSIK